jgi:ribonucleotide reductase alpha subunit
MGIGKKIKAQDIWSKIIESQVETGVPYLCAKDSANKKTNHKNIGVIKQSNLCNEIYQFTDEETTAICTLSSMVLKNFIVKGEFDFTLLYNEVRKVVRSLNKVINIKLKLYSSLLVSIQGRESALYRKQHWFDD